MVWEQTLSLKIQVCTLDTGCINVRAAAAAAKLLQLCPTLCDPIDSSPPGSPIPGILLARTLEWVAISFSNAWKWKVKVKSLSHVQLLPTPWTAYQAPPSVEFSRQEYWSRVPLPSPPVTARRFQNCVFFHRGSPCRLDLVLLSSELSEELSARRWKRTHSTTYLAQWECLMKEGSMRRKTGQHKEKAKECLLHTAQKGQGQNFRCERKSNSHLCWVKSKNERNPHAFSELLVSSLFWKELEVQYRPTRILSHSVTLPHL